MARTHDVTREDAICFYKAEHFEFCVVVERYLTSEKELFYDFHLGCEISLVKGFSLFVETYSAEQLK